MPLYTLDPTRDSRWDDLVASHPRASAFHRVGWLKALAETYGYRPMVLSSSPVGRELSDGIVFCEVNSWATGSRLVSLPFADHAEPLFNERGEFQLTEWLRSEGQTKRWKYIELRPLSWNANPDNAMSISQSFVLHSLDLTPSLEEIFRNLHKDCIQRRIRRAEREHLSYEIGTSEVLLDDFYRLLMKTRRRHHLPPQPRLWFRKLITHMTPDIQIRVARKDSVAIAAIMTLQHRGTVVYKYGCSDDKYHNLAGMPFLFWKLIEESKSNGAVTLDFGRTDLQNEGLIKFKDQFGTTRSRLSYLRYPESANRKNMVASYLPLTERFFSVVPDALYSRLGQLLYRHIG